MSSQSKPIEGQSTSGQSGKAIALFKHSGSMPEYVSKNHIEEGLTELGWLIFECIQ